MILVIYSPQLTSLQHLHNYQPVLRVRTPSFRRENSWVPHIWVFLAIILVLMQASLPHYKLSCIRQGVRSFSTAPVLLKESFVSVRSSLLCASFLTVFYLTSCYRLILSIIWMIQWRRNPKGKETNACSEWFQENKKNKTQQNTAEHNKNGDGQARHQSWKQNLVQFSWSWTLRNWTEPLAIFKGQLQLQVKEKQQHYYAV